jgi:RNA polymerase sigma-70 factor, ECF subfamily
VADPYEDLRPLLFSIAYRMMGDAGDAEDIVQEAFLRFHDQSRQGNEILSPKAWLSTVTTRLAINYLKSARVRREAYVGPWLPEPIVTGPSGDGAEAAELADSLSLASLVLLQSLTPVERAVFLLHDVFEYEYGEIAEIVEKSEDNCRQIATRARRQINKRRPRFAMSPAKRAALAERFFAAVSVGDTDGLISMLTDDAIAYTDGGGKARAVLHPVRGPAEIADLFFPARLLEIEAVHVNGQPGAVMLDADGQPRVVVALSMAENKVQLVHAVSNPDKLRYITRTLEIR